MVGRWILGSNYTAWTCKKRGSGMVPTCEAGSHLEHCTRGHWTSKRKRTSSNSSGDGGGHEQENSHQQKWGDDNPSAAFVPAGLVVTNPWQVGNASAGLTYRGLQHSPYRQRQRHHLAAINGCRLSVRPASRFSLRLRIAVNPHRRVNRYATPMIRSIESLVEYPGDSRVTQFPAN